MGHKSFQHSITSAQESLLARGLNLPSCQSTPKEVLHHIGGEGMYQNPHGSRGIQSRFQPLAQELLPPTKPNLITEEYRAIKKLRKDQSQLVLTADKGVAMAVMDKEHYTDKALSLLADTTTYSIINKDPTTKLKNKLSQTLRDIKQTGGLSECSYRKVFPLVLSPKDIFYLGILIFFFLRPNEAASVWRL